MTVTAPQFSNLILEIWSGPKNELHNSPCLPCCDCLLPVLLPVQLINSPSRTLGLDEINPDL